MRRAPKPNPAYTPKSRGPAPVLSIADEVFNTKKPDSLITTWNNNFIIKTRTAWTISYDLLFKHIPFNS